MSEPLLSICSIFKDECANVKPLIAARKDPRVEWVVVDTGSSDGTQERLYELGIEPYVFEWAQDFSAARNFGLAKAKGKWILWLDGDDRLDDENWRKILEFVERAPAQKAYRMIIENPMDSGEGESFRQLRLFPNFRGVEFKGRVHEELGESCREQGVLAETLDVVIQHQGYFDEESRRAKSLRNFEILSVQKKENPEDPFVCMALGNAYHQQGDWKKAKEEYLLALHLRGEKTNSALVSLELLLGNVCKEQAPEEAKDWYKKSTRIAPEYLSAFYEWGRLAMNEGDFVSAETLFEKVLVSPEFVNQVAESPQSLKVNSAGFLALILWHKKNFQRALDCLEKAWSYGRGLSVDPWVPLEIAFVLKDVASGKKWEKRLQLQANTEYQGSILQWLNECDLLLSRERWLEVINDIEKRPQELDLWEELKVLVRKFDNNKRSRDALFVRGISEEIIENHLG